MQGGHAAAMNRRTAIEHDRRDHDGMQPGIGQPVGHGYAAEHEHGDDERWNRKNRGDDEQRNDALAVIGGFRGVGGRGGFGPLVGGPFGFR